MSDDARLLKPAKPAPPSNVWSEYEIEAKTSLTDRALCNLKYGDAFAVMDARGDIGALGETAEGLYYRDTRFLSKFEVRLDGKQPLLLSSAVHEDKAALTVELTNPDVEFDDRDRLPRDTIFFHRTKFLWQTSCYERINIRNYGRARRRLRLDFLYDADFRDLFEVRGTRRPKRGRVKSHVSGTDRVEFQYLGLDEVERRTVLQFSPAPTAIGANRATVEIELDPYQHVSLFVTISCAVATIPFAAPCDFFRGYREIRKARCAATADIATVTSTNPSFDDVVCRATADTYTLVTRGANGPYPYAGIPWFNTIFGRDGLITAMQMLWLDPSIAAGVLRTLAAMQATEIDPYADAQPGKILHETRHGEMARLREVPFGRYYGTIDATPLFVMLAGMYLDRTGDLKTIRQIWPNIRAALTWIDRYGDIDGDGFVEYSRAEESGLANQGWKDSHDAIFHADGSDPVGPIALCEVQGYVFAAKTAAARIANLLDEPALAVALSAQAEQLRQRFEQAFWCPQIDSYALALDGRKKPCQVIASNAGHALFTGIASADRARRVAQSLLSADAFSGWGIRTLALGQPRFNPMSYHNGSVWPHDNALVAIGFARYGLKAEAARVFASIFDTARHQDLNRLPELFCGFTRRPNRGPTPYPVACAPQAWAAGAVFGLLGACLGIDIRHDRDEIRFRDPVMPDFLDEIVIRNLSLGSSRLDVRLHRYGLDVAATVLARRGSADVLVLR
ncbi:amylo-alpha-1,6-glucosidase [Afipia sp. P52-10]|uniref:amylo-alpha-1,6-glucosidase n=1 Tax=Afipia sp. P52-10 TaxID=1429916 RepID=UPI0003DF1E03|nr:amylo-alpha-1,6-glucosidase [Afipia sp. P52-10]ETR76371.1 amylo-alpha-1,6-glucosidase [Afipia sp. P52-10]